MANMETQNEKHKAVYDVYKAKWKSLVKVTVDIGTEFNFALNPTKLQEYITNSKSYGDNKLYTRKIHCVVLPNKP